MFRIRLGNNSVADVGDKVSFAVFSTINRSIQQTRTSELTSSDK
jgi:hypothetical protein